MALEILGRFKDGSFLEWANSNLNKVESCPLTPREILPEREGLRVSATVEVSGLSDSGKSTGMKFLVRELRGIRSVFLPELELQDPSGRTITREEVRILRDLGLEFENNVLARMKLASFVQGSSASLRLLMEDAKRERPGDPILILSERGPNDVLIFSDFMGRRAFFKKELSGGLFTGGVDLGGVDWNRYLYPGYGKDFLEIFLHGLGLAETVDAMILFGVSRETALKRREGSGLLTEAPMLEPRNWSLWEMGCGWWLGSIYPLLRERFGTGLLVIDGEGGLEENNRILLEYCQKVVNP